MLHVHAERRTKCALGALRLELQLVTLSPDLVHQLTWEDLLTLMEVQA